MERHELLDLFKTDSQNWKIVNHILTFGKIYNHEIHSAYGICCHTARITEIRSKISPHGFNLVPTQTEGTNEYKYEITKTGEIA